MEKELIIIAKRDDAQKNLYKSLSSLALFTTFLILDTFFYIRDKQTWQLVILIISAVFAGFELILFLFNWSIISYSKKIKDVPLISFNPNDKTFIVNDCVLHKEVLVYKEDIIEIRISDKGETYLWYQKDLKKSSIFIGYSNKGSEDLINNEVQKYKNFC